jgi:hypothetical protein
MAFVPFTGLGRYEFSLFPGSKIAAYVHSGGAVSGMHKDVVDRLHTTLNEGLAQARASKGDVVYVLPGHTEDIASADQMNNLKAGTRIVGGGHGNLRPTFTWTTAGSTFLLDVANVTIENCVLLMAADNSGVSVTAPMTISAAGCGLYGNRIQFSYDADDLATIAITTTAAADDLTLIGNHCHGATAGEVTTFMDIIGCDRLVMEDNYIQGATSNVAVGIVRFATTASLDISLKRNHYGNLKALSTCAVTGLAGVSGSSMNEHFHYLDNASDTPWLTSSGLMAFHEAFVTNFAGEVGLIATPVSV